MDNFSFICNTIGILFQGAFFYNPANVLKFKYLCEPKLDVKSVISQTFRGNKKCLLTRIVFSDLLNAPVQMDRWKSGSNTIKLILP